MKIKIYQINMDRDNGSYSFTNYENTIRRTGGGIRSSIYAVSYTHLTLPTILRV